MSPTEARAVRGMEPLTSVNGLREVKRRMSPFNFPTDFLIAQSL